MSSNYRTQKVLKKQRRCCAIICGECDIRSSDIPTRFLGILNAGLSTGLTDEAILSEANRYGEVQQLLMLPGKSYAFLICPGDVHAESIFFGMHNKSKLGQNDAVLFLSYFESVPSLCNPWTRPLPPGLILLTEFVTEDEEKSLLDIINMPQESKLEANSLKHRQVMHFGYEFVYGINNVYPDRPLDQKIPAECNCFWPRLKQLCDRDMEIAWSGPDQLTVNVYQPGQGIPPHVDTHSAFCDPILSLSLESDIVMDFRKKNDRFSLVLPRRSLLIISAESRYDWSHGIAPRLTDVVPTKDGSLTTKQRSKRTSFTFRRLRRGPCDCNFPRLCDTRQKPNPNTTSVGDLAVQLEKTNVHDVYEQIAEHFSETRHKPWPQVTQFLNGFDCGSVVIDVGCGNGKYLSPNDNILKIGCDRSKGLLQICASRRLTTFICDCLCLPIRSSSVEGCISIAVIHHLITPERRLAAIKEMARILTSGGRCLIYVWAKDQRSDSKKSSYLLQNKAINKKKTTQDEQRQQTALNLKVESQSEDSLLTLPIHTNRTEFQQQDVLVPWKLKKSQSDSSTFLRYYHVFEKGELEDLVIQIPEVSIAESYYDQGNHCVIFKKS